MTAPARNLRLAIALGIVAIAVYAAYVLLHLGRGA